MSGTAHPSPDGAPSPDGERVVAYVDGFNLYEGLRATRWSGVLWLDLRALVSRFVLGGQELGAVKYFTADRREPPDERKRQQLYRRALTAHGGVEIVTGHFDRGNTLCRHCGRMTVFPRERATDVNLAAAMVADAARDLYDVAILVTGDGDFISAVEEAQSFGKLVKLVHPPERVNDDLADRCDFAYSIFKAQLLDTQLPGSASPATGPPISCPFEWLAIAEKALRLNGHAGKYLRSLLDAVRSEHYELLNPIADALAAESSGPAGD